MVTGIIGKKVGMTQLFAQDGTVSPGHRRSRPVRASSCRRRRAATDGYEAVQLGLVEERPARVRKPLAGHYKKAGVPPTRVRREVKRGQGRRAAEGRRPGARRPACSPTATAST